MPDRLDVAVGLDGEGVGVAAEGEGATAECPSLPHAVVNNSARTDRHENRGILEVTGFLRYLNDVL